MPFYHWSERLSVGVAELDSDHQVLIQLIDRLHDALEYNEGRSSLDQIFESLAVYIETHFAREERVMEACGYPEISEHKKQHLDFTQNIIHIRDRYFRGEDTEVGHDLLDQLRDWWNHHILLMDMGYKPYVEDNDLVNPIRQPTACDGIVTLTGRTLTGICCNQTAPIRLSVTSDVTHVVGIWK